MPLVQGSSRQAIAENIRREMGAHRPQKQAIAIASDVARRNRYAEGGRADEPRKPPMPRPNPFRQPQLPRPRTFYEILAQSYGNLERQMGIPEMDRVLQGLEKIKNYPELRPTTQQDRDDYFAKRAEFYRGEGVPGAKLRIDPTAVDRMPQSTNIEYWSPVTPDDFYGERSGSARTPLGIQIRKDYADGGRADYDKPPMPRPNPFRSSQPPRPLSFYETLAPPRPFSFYETLAQSYGNLERQMGIPDMDRVVYGAEDIKNYPELRPTTQQDRKDNDADYTKFLSDTVGKLRMDPAAIDRMPQSTNIEYRWPVTPDDIYGDRFVRRDYASGGRTMQPIQRAGLITSTVPGRTDKHSINVLSGSYILPADHVAHLGQDNSMAGGRVLDSMFETNSARRKNAPVTGDIVPIVVAGGEYLLEPDQVESVGDGDLTKGHNALDVWVKSGRKKHITLLKSLPPPKTK